jgi:ABC-type antimicrobial peptide transport system permease subunit
MMNSDIMGNSLRMDTVELQRHFEEEASGTIRQHDIFLYGELIGKSFNPTIPRVVGTISPENIELTFRVDSFLTGYPEHIDQGLGANIFMMRYILSAGESEIMNVELARYEEHGGTLSTNTIVDEMIIGQRYLVRAELIPQWIVHQHDSRSTPQVGEQDENMIMLPLNLDCSIRIRSLTGAPIWFLCAEEGEDIDLMSIPGLEQMQDRLDMIRHSQSEIYLRTTVDMTALPIMQTQRPLLALRDGRWITREDYLSGNPVAVVHYWFAQTRGLQLGDKIVVDIPKAQTVVGTGLSPGGSGTPDLEIISAPGENLVSGLELTVVGMYDAVGSEGVSVPHTVYIYIPDSILPNGFVYTPATRDETMLRELAMFLAIQPLIQAPAYEDRDPALLENIGNPDFLPDIWYSFTLGDPREVSEFLLEHRDILSAHGYRIDFFERDAETFWVSADQILRTVTINAAIFCAVLFAVLILVTFLYIRQRRREYAIMRALGVPAGRVNRQLLAALMGFGAPVILAGCTGGWFFAVNTAAETLNPLSDFAWGSQTGLDTSLSAVWVIALTASVLACLMILTIIGVARLSRQSVLSLLQGVTGAAAATGAAGSKDKPKAAVTEAVKRSVSKPLPC